MDITENAPDTTKRDYGYVPAVALFNLPPRDISIESIVLVDYGTTSVVNSISPLEFLIDGHGKCFIDTQDIRLHLRTKIVQADGSDLTSAHKASLANNPIASLFGAIECYVNQQMVESCSMYGYKSMLETILFSTEAKYKNFQSLGLYTKEVADQLENISFGNSEEAFSSTNYGLSNRADLYSESKEVELIGRVNLDLFKTERYLLNACQLQLKFRQNTDAFRIISGDDNANYKVSITNAFLRVPLVTLKPKVFLGIAEGIKERPALYPYMRTDMKTWVIKTGTSGDQWDNPFNGKTPARLIMTIVPQENFSGAYNKNPYVFKHYDMTNLCFEVNGQSLPTRPISTDFPNDRYMEAFSTLFSISDGKDTWYPEITRTEYKNGYFFVVFDIQPIINETDFVQQRIVGNTRITVKFKNNMTETIVVMLHAAFPAVMAIDENRHVYPALH